VPQFSLTRDLERPRSTRKTETTFARVVVIASTQLIDTQIDTATDIVALGSSAANLLVTQCVPLHSVYSQKFGTKRERKSHGGQEIHREMNEILRDDHLKDSHSFTPVYRYSDTINLFARCWTYELVQRSRFTVAKI